MCCMAEAAKHVLVARSAVLTQYNAIMTVLPPTTIKLLVIASSLWLMAAWQQCSTASRPTL